MRANQEEGHRPIDTSMDRSIVRRIPDWLPRARARADAVKAHCKKMGPAFMAVGGGFIEIAVERRIEEDRREEEDRRRTRTMGTFGEEDRKRGNRNRSIDRSPIGRR